MKGKVYGGEVGGLSGFLQGTCLFKTWRRCFRRSFLVDLHV